MDLKDVYGDHAPSKPICKYWFQRFKGDNFDVNDKERFPQNEELEELFDIDPCQPLEELSPALDVDRFAVGRRLHALGMVQKARNWIPYDLKERDFKRKLITCEMLL
ncbi:hypothetical protein Trydic_g21127 [Trypoxylus dichotomus]